MGYGGTYNAVPLNDTATPLMFGKTGELPAEPVAWVNRYTPGSRVFFTSLGSAEHFEVPAFTQLLRNGLGWCLGEAARRWRTPVESANSPPRGARPHSATVLAPAPADRAGALDPGAQPRPCASRRAESTAGGQKFSAGRWPPPVTCLPQRRATATSTARALRRRTGCILDFSSRATRLGARPAGRHQGVFFCRALQIEIAAPLPSRRAPRASS